MDGSATIKVAGQPLWLLRQRAVYWPAERALLVADLHLGRVESMQKRGISVPSGDTGRTLERLEQLCRWTGADDLLILGDLVHSALGLTSEAIEQLQSVLNRAPVQTRLIPGNHDKPSLKKMQKLPVRIERAPLNMGPFCFSHEPLDGVDGYNLAGHLHPTVRLETTGDEIRQPCFRFGDASGVLPAFTDLANGVVQPIDSGRIFVPTKDGVVPVN